MKQTISQQIEALAAELGISVRTAWSWHREGAPVDDVAETCAWAIRRGKNAVSSPRLEAARRELLHEQIRKLKFANDATESRMVPRAWLQERMRRALGELSAARARMEPEHASRLAAVGPDIARARQEIRGVWDDIFKFLQSGMAKHFEEET